MKVCPVCKSTLFDDMDVCYGCMHRFDGEEGVDMAKRSLEAASGLDVAALSGAQMAREGAPLDGAAPVPPCPAGAWREGAWHEGNHSGSGETDAPDFLVRVEVRDPREEGKVWAVELTPRFGSSPAVEGGARFRQNEESAPCAGALSEVDDEQDLFGDVD